MNKTSGQSKSYTKADAIIVRDMRNTDRELIYSSSIGPRKAVICAYAYDRGDQDTQSYESRYGKLIEEGRWFLFCGNFAVRKITQESVT